MAYIDREKMLKYLEETNTDGEWIVGQYNADWIYSFIESQPAADVEEVKHGEWIRGGIWGDTGSVEYKCSVCRETTYDADLLPRCPHCGAKMDGQ